MSLRSSSTTAASAGLPVVGVLLLLGVWQWLAAGPLDDTGLPQVGGTLDALRELVGQSGFWTSISQTLRQALIGFVISVAVALPLGLYVGTSPFGYHATKVVVEVLKAIPAIVVLPLAVLQLGASGTMSIFLVAFTLIPMLIVTVAAGARDADPVTLDAARSYGLGPLARTWRVIVPSAVPFIATGLRVGASFALIVAVVAGLFGGAPGLGHDLDTYRQAGVLETSFAYLFVLGVLGIALNAVLGLAERRVLFWHESVRNDAPARDARDTRAVAHVPSSRRARVWSAQDAAERSLDRVTSSSTATKTVRTLASLRLPVPAVLRPGFLRVVMVLVPLAIVAMWWWRSSGSSNPYFPPLSDSVDRFRDVWLGRGALDNAVPSLRNLAVGFVVGSAVGVLAGAVIGQVRWLLRMLGPLISFMRSIPSIAYVPILIAIIGFTAPMRVTAITLAAFFPILIATIDGVRSIDETLLDATRSYRVPGLISFVSVRLPAALPRIFAGAELGLVAALIVMVASELIGTSEGIGAQVLLAQQSFLFSDMWAGIVLLAVIGIATNVLFRLARGRALAWYDGARAASRAS